MEYLKSLLAAILNATGVEPEAFETKKKGKDLPAITYQYYRAIDNGAVAQYRLETRVSASTYVKALEIEGKIAKAIVTTGDETPLGCSISSNGGGSLKDLTADCPQLITYFDITARS